MTQKKLEEIKFNMWQRMISDDDIRELITAVEVSQKVISVAQGVLTALNVGDIQKESLLHLHLREAMIKYREKIK